MVGGLVGGVLSDYLLIRTGSRRIARQYLAVGSLIVCLIFYGAAYVVPNATLATLTASAGFFIFCFSAPCAVAVTMDMGGPNLGIIFGFMNMAGNFGPLFFIWIAPRLNARYGGSWTPTLILFAVMHVIALLFWLPLNPNGVIGERLPESME